MKKTILLIALAITSTISYGQSNLDKLEDMDGVMSVVISKDAFKILSKFNLLLINSWLSPGRFDIDAVIFWVLTLSSSIW